MNYLGLDYGKAKIGVSLANGPLAAPLTTLITLPIENSVKAIEELIKKHRVIAIIIGDSPKSFVAELRHLNLPVFVVDETLSSHDARRALLHTTRIKRKILEHSAAATIILQSWLDSHSPS